MNSHFIITSAIHTSYGKSSTEQHIDKKLVEHIDIMKLEGYWAPKGSWIEE